MTTVGKNGDIISVARQGPDFPRNGGVICAGCVDRAAYGHRPRQITSSGVLHNIEVICNTLGENRLKS